jgi:hypothetical protein
MSSEDIVWPEVVREAIVSRTRIRLRACGPLDGEHGVIVMTSAMLLAISPVPFVTQTVLPVPWLAGFVSIATLLCIPALNRFRWCRDMSIEDVKESSAPAGKSGEESAR